MKITSVTIQGMHHVAKKTYTFNDINYLHGPNGAGKSTVLNAIQLAILGYIPGTPKQVSAIFQHASAPEMKIRVNFDDGRYIERKWAAKGKSVTSEVSGSFDADSITELIGDLELPIFNFNELMSLTANKLKDWFINFLPAASSNIDWNAELTNCLDGIVIMDPDILKNALNSLNADDGKSTLEKIQAFNAEMKSNQSFLKSELQRAESTVQSLIYYDEDGLVGDAEYLDGEVKRAQDEIRRLTEEKERMIRASQVANSNENIRNQLSMIRVPSAEEVETMKAQYANMTSSIRDLESSISDEEATLAEKMSKSSQLHYDMGAKASIIKSKGICPYTSTTCGSIQSMVEEFTTQVAAMQDECNNIAAEASALRDSINRKKQAITELRTKLNELGYRINDAANAENSRTRLESMLQAESDMSVFQDAAAYSVQIDALNQQISKIGANKQYNLLIDKLTSEKYKLENTMEVYKLWAKLTDPNGLQTRIMNDPFKNLAEEMNRYLGIMFSEDITCKFNLEQKANSFSFGINRGTRYIPYDLLSSGEKTMYTLALMLCIIDKSSSQLKLLIIDDMLDHLDNTRADEVFKSLQAIPDIQIILAGVKDSDNAKDFSIEINK